MDEHFTRMIKKRGCGRRMLIKLIDAWSGCETVVKKNHGILSPW